MPSSFASLPLVAPLLQAVAELGYTHLTPIQEQALPPLLAGLDLIGQSQTGTGKTVAFALPLLQRLRSERELQALILCPTRELCAQVAREVRRLGRHFQGLRVVELAGGQPLGPQAGTLERGVHVAVGTPGRIIDHLQRGTLDLRNVGTLVLDEADRMLDMGFTEQVEQIISATPESRQTVLFSATLPPSIVRISAVCQQDPVQVRIAEPSGVAAIRHVAFPTAPDTRLDTLLAVLAAYRPDSAILFCNLKVTVAEVADALTRAGYSADALHGDLDQFDRDRVMAKFRNQSTRLLVATDVAARGIDVAQLDAVINVDLPAQPEIYVHRVGRTGRAGATGIAVSLATPRDSSKLARIEALMGVTFETATATATPPTTSTGTAATMVTLRIGGGRKDKLRPGDILGALTGEGGLTKDDVGRIETHDHHTFVAVSAPVVDRAFAWLQEGRIKARRFRVVRVG